MAADLAALEAILGHTFEDRNLLLRALTHRSFSSELPPDRPEADNEQLEFFGDAILGFIVSEALVARYPSAPEGWLSRARSHLVSARWLHSVAQRIDLGRSLQLGRGEEHSGGRVKPSLLADALEAIIAAVYLDAGLATARAFVLSNICNGDIPAVGEDANYKGRLWELAGARKLPRPEYDVVGTVGPPHAPEFTVEARLGELFTGRGAGKSKKAAEQEAARAILQSLDNLA